MRTKSAKSAKYLLIISIILLSTFVLGCINKIEPSSESKVILDQKHPSQTYTIYIDDPDNKGNVEIAIDGILQTNIQIVQGVSTYTWTIYGNNITKGDHEIRFHDEEGNSFDRDIINNIGNDIVSTNTNNSQNNPIDYNTLSARLINVTILILMLIVVALVYQIIKTLKKKGPIFKDLVLICPNCKNRDIYHDFKKVDLINIYKCPICGNPRVVSTKVDDLIDEQYSGMVEFKNE